MAPAAIGLPDLIVNAQRRHRDSRQLQHLNSTVQLGQSWTSQLNSKLAWTGRDFQDDSQYIVSLSEEDLAEINQALLSFKGS